MSASSSNLGSMDMPKKKVPRSQRGLLKTGIMIAVALVFVCVNLFIKQNGNSNVLTSRNVSYSSNLNSIEKQRRLLWYEDKVLFNIDEDAECTDVHDIDDMEDKCKFVTALDDCANDEGFFEYTQFVYCDIGNEAGAMVILVLWWLFCFVGLAVCADDYFCPSLVVITKTLRLSNNVAGVTFLAFGNGAPDLFSAIAALGGIEDGDSGLAVGGLFGAGIFVTTVVVGTIAVIKPFKAMERPFLRDATFYLFGVYWTFFVLWKGKMYFGEAIGFIMAYVFYVLVVVVSGSVYKRQQANEKANQPQEDLSPYLKENGMENGKESVPTRKLGKGEANIAMNELGNTGSFKQLGVPELPKSPTTLTIEEIYANKAFDPDEPMDPIDPKSLQKNKLSIYENLNIMDENGVVPDSLEQNDLPNFEVQSEESYEEITPFREFLNQLNPINVEEWNEMKIYVKAYEIFKAPIIFVITLTCPVVNYEDEIKHNWCRYLQCLQCLLGPPICLLLVGAGTTKIDGVFPVWALSLLIGAALALLIFFTSENENKPKYHWAFGYAEFFIAIVWIYVIANEIVSLLQTFGVVFNISQAILGLTLLAWGNSIGDWIADSLMARQGFARMGFAACFGAPFFNLMLGFGIPLLIKMIQDGTSEVQMQISSVQLILSVFLMVNMIAVMVLLVVIKFKVRRFIGMYLLVYYIVFLVVAILAEVGIILDGWAPTASIKSGLEEFYPD